MAPSRAATPASSSDNEPDGPRVQIGTAPVASTSKVPSSPTSQDDDVVVVSPKVNGKQRADDASDLDDAELAREEAHLNEGDEDDWILLATVKTNVVDCLKYPGIKSLKAGMLVDLRQDRTSAVMKNAIEVRLEDTTRVGLVAKPIANRLSPLWQQGWISAESATVGEIPKSIVGVTSIPILVHVYGTRSFGRDPRLDFAFPARQRRKALEQERRVKQIEEEERLMALERLKKAAAVAKQEDEDRDAEMELLEVVENPTEVMEQLTKASQKVPPPPPDMLAELFKEGGNDPTRLPLHPCPPGKKDKSMRSDLMDFQKQGLAWMIKMEHPQLPRTVDDPPTQLWLKHIDGEGKPVFYNVATEETQREKPVLKRGGILADEMGLGKTMQTIALICTDDTGKGVVDPPEEPDDRFDDMTLIVCPLSVASNWTVQLHQHVGSKRLRWHLYHGEGRELNKKQLRKFDVVIATYQTVAAEIREARSDGPPAAKKAKPDSKKEDTLHQIKWRRVVLDEGHVIKNPKAKMSVACASLKAERRWILTGTPIINSTNDLGAIVGFLRVCRPLDERGVWQHYIGDGKRHSDSTAKRLRAVVASTTLRRTKDMTDASGRPIVKLPKITYYIHRVKLHEAAQKLYDEIAARLAAIVENLEKQGRDRNNYQHILVYLLRLRQLACDPRLCPDHFIADVRQDKLQLELEDKQENADGLTRARSVDLTEHMREWIETNGSCLLCDSNPPVDPCITVCSHVFCSGCIDRQVSEYACCPVCRMHLDDSMILSPELPSENVSTAGDFEATNISLKKAASAKSEKLIEFLNGTEAGVKSLVFSQWTTHLQCIEVALDAAGIVSCRFDGSMSQEKREALIKEFSAPIKPGRKKLKKGERGPPTVMLISLKAGALGLNLTCASQVFLMDPWWQASIESQAIDRVWRIGQTRDVKVFQLVAEGTVEDQVLAVQDKKRKLIASAFAATANAVKPTEKIDTKITEIKEILGIKQA